MRVILSKLRLADFTDPVIYFFWHSERMREKSLGSLLCGILGHEQKLAVKPQTVLELWDLFSCSREGWSLTAATDLETLRMTRKVPSPRKAIKVEIHLKRPGESLAFLSWTGLRGAAIV